MSFPTLSQKSNHPKTWPILISAELKWRKWSLYQNLFTFHFMSNLWNENVFNSRTFQGRFLPTYFLIDVCGNYMLNTCTYFSVFNLTWLFISPIVLNFIFYLLKLPGKSTEAILTHFSSTAHIYFSICVKSKEQLSFLKLWSFQKCHLWSNSESLSDTCRQHIIYKLVYICWKEVLFHKK